MTTLDLKTAIDLACDDLRLVTEAVAKIGGKGTLSKDSNDFFQLSSTLQTQLEQAKELIPVRHVALQAIKSFPTQTSTKSPNRFLYNGHEVSFKDGRFLALQNYAVTTWALYDSLSKIAGVLCCVDELSKNLARPVKLYEHFLQGKDLQGKESQGKGGSVGGRVRDHLSGSYGWPIAVSYKIRNWLAHDGHCQDGVEMFKYESPIFASEFEMLDAAWGIIEKKCHPHTAAKSRRLPFPEMKTDLVDGLEICHEEVDEAMAFLVRWSTGIVKLQASILFPRDS